MKILQINKYHYVKGGTETVFFNTIKLLEENGHEVFRFCLKDKRNQPCTDENYFVDYPEMSSVGFFKKIKHCFAFFYNKEACRKIERLIIDKKPDVAHIHLLFNGISVSILPILKKYNIPIVMTVHDYRLICPAYLFLDGNNRICEKCKDKNYFHCIKNKCHNNDRFTSTMLCLDMYFRNIFYPLTKYVDKFLFVSQFTFEKHCSFNKNYAKKGKLLYNFLDYSNTSNQSALLDNKKYYFYFGRLSREKGISTLIEAAKASGIQLKLAGTGPILNEYKNMLPNQIEFVGFKSGKELQDLIQNAYFAFVPSKCYETFGLTVLESMALGVPVIGAKIGAIPELIEDGKNGFLFESGNVNELTNIIKAVENLSIEDYTEISMYAKNSAKQFSASRYYDSLINTFEDILHSDNL